MFLFWCRWVVRVLVQMFKEIGLQKVHPSVRLLLHALLSIIQGDDSANAINPHSTTTLRTVSIPHIINHFTQLLYDNGDVNTATK